MLKFIFSIVYYVVLAVVIAVAVILVLPVLPIQGNIQTKVVLSGSMEPAIHVGSVIVIKPEDTYAVGDVVTFGKDTKTNIPTTHRLFASHIQNGVLYYQTKGDANEDPDAREITSKDIEGKVLFSIPYLGYFIDFAKRPLGFFIIIILPAAFIVLDELRKIYIEMRNMRGKKKREAEEERGTSYPSSDSQSS